MTNKVVVRRAVPWDVVRVTRMMAQAAKDQAKEIWFPQVDESGAKALFYMLTLISNGLVVVAESEKDGRIVGAIGVGISKEAWSDDWFALIEWTYVLPSYRKSGIAGSMMTYIERFADDKSLPIVIGILSGSDVQAKDDMIRRRGYQHGGGNFVRRPGHGEEEE